MVSMWSSCCILLLISFISGQVLADKSVCYPPLGCHIPRPGSSKLPESPTKINTTFFLYTRGSSPSGEIISHMNLGSSFNPRQPIKFITHGFTDRASNKWVINMKDELLRLDEMNVIAVDWSRGNQFPYDQAVANTVLVGAVINQLLQTMITVGVRPEQIHLIGHSLGAHVSGYAGRLTPGLGRISGLDPAGPDFYKATIDDRLDPSDARFVDVIHTNGEDREYTGFGYSGPLGHVDFYPNGGYVQPTCGRHPTDVIFQSLGSLFGTFNIENALDTLACNHMSAIYYFTNSINSSPAAMGYPCSDYKNFEDGQCTSCGVDKSQCQPIGYHASPDRTLAKLYLKTLHGTKAPIYGTHLQVTVTSHADNDPQTQGATTLRFNGHPDVVLFNQNTRMTPNFQKSTTVLVSSYPSAWNEISLSFQKSFQSNWGLGLADQWRFSTVTILDMESDESYKFCPTSEAKIKSGSFLTFGAC